MATVSKKEIIDKISNGQKIKKLLVRKIVQNFLDEMTTELVGGNRLEFRDFGIFETKDKPAWMAQNPKTHEPVEVPAKRAVKFKMGRLMKKKLGNVVVISQGH